MRGVPALSPPFLRDVLARTAIDVRSLAGDVSYRRFVIIGIARTGSTLLVDLLNAHSQALTFGELFRAPDAIGWDIAPFSSWKSEALLALYREDPLAFIRRRVFRRWPRSIGAVGFKLFYYHAREYPHSMIWDYLRDDKEICVLHIKRRNILEQYLSLRRAHLTDVWSSAQPDHQPASPLHLDVEACRRHFGEVRAFETECDAVFSRHSMLPVFYEDLAACKEAEMLRIQRFLGLDEAPLDTRIKRQRTEPIAQAISNYEELRQAFAGTEWAAFFDGPQDGV